ncbi:MAG: cyclic pyranopterin monophosphate synthase MoaC [Puniceicoccaceae bacterium]
MKKPTENPGLNHLDDKGDPMMVDISTKTPTTRIAKAEAVVIFPPEVFAALSQSGWQSAKGSVWQTAVIAGTQAVKKTSELIPFCHPLAIERCKFAKEEVDEGLRLICEVGVSHKTGVEMEALTGVSVAALTIIDMCKALSADITIERVRLLEKVGGKRTISRE